MSFFTVATFYRRHMMTVFFAVRQIKMESMAET
jgi:hypothetical protein